MKGFLSIIIIYIVFSVAVFSEAASTDSNTFYHYQLNQNSAIITPKQNSFDFYRHNFKQVELFQMIVNFNIISNIKINRLTVKSIRFSEKIGYFYKDIENRVKLGITKSISRLEEPAFKYIKNPIICFVYSYCNIQD